MESIFLTGSSGFVGKNLKKQFTTFNIEEYERNSEININSNIIIHLAGKAHDLRFNQPYEEYYESNTELTKRIYDAFLVSKAKVFIMLSSVKAAAESVDEVLNENFIPNPTTHYGKSKFLAEQYIIKKGIREDKRFYILRPSMIHGPENKGNLNLLYRFVSFGLPWPLGSFENKRSFCSIDNLFFVIKELIYREDIISGIYNIADEQPLSTNDLIRLIASSQNKKIKILKMPIFLIKFIAMLGDIIGLPINNYRLQKLTESFVVSNAKLKQALGKSFPVNSYEGLKKTFEYFNN